MKRRVTLTSIILLFITFQGMTQTPIEGMDRKMDSLFSHYNAETPGVSVAVVKDGKIVFTKGYGRANLEYGIPNTPQTVFQIASVSKQFTAFAIYLLEKQGKLSFEDDIRKYIPELPQYGKTIKIKYLLAHTSGLRDQAALLALAGWQVEDVITTDQILKVALKQKELNFETGTTFGYSNTGYTLLAKIAERITGQSFADFTRKNIFEPLGMTNTQIYDDYHAIVKNRAHSYEKRNDAYVKVELNCSNAGPSGVLTTVEDMAKWVNNFDHPKAGDSKLIAEFNKISLLDNAEPVVWSAREGDTTYHAKGQLHWRYRGLHVISHGGHTAGFRAGLTRFPENNFSVIALSNDEHYDILGIAKKIIGFYLKDELEEEANTANPIINETKNQTANYNINLNDFKGDYYSDELTTGYSIKVNKDKVTMTHHRLSDIELTRIGENKFSGINSFAFEIEFVKSGKEITGFTISNFGAKNVKFRRVRS
ncbi:MAG: serine hydrolase domain-containing protein [Chryseolinea sp.]